MVKGEWGKMEKEGGMIDLQFAALSHLARSFSTQKAWPSGNKHLALPESCWCLRCMSIHRLRAQLQPKHRVLGKYNRLSKIFHEIGNWWLPHTVHVVKDLWWLDLYLFFSGYLKSKDRCCQPEDMMKVSPWPQTRFFYVDENISRRRYFLQRPQQSIVTNVIWFLI